MKFEDEDTRTFFHLLDTDVQVFFYELESYLHSKHKHLCIDKGNITEDGELELVLRIVD